MLFCAFNKHIATELQQRVPSNCTAQTLNAYGHGVCMQGIKPKPSFDQEKTFKICNTYLGRDARYMRGPVSKLIGLCKSQGLEDCDFNTMTNFMLMHDIEYKGRMEELFAGFSQVFKADTRQTSVINFDDQLYYPIILDLPFRKYDLVMVDESQDLNFVQMEMVSRISERVVIVGDTRQAIYGFRGADPEAMENFINRLGATVKPLSICYRCPKLVVEAAQKIVPEIEYSETAADGTVDKVKKDEFKKRVADADYVLCRTTAPLVGSCLSFIRDGRKATVKGRDIGENLISLVEKIAKDNLQMLSEDFNLLLQKYFQEEVTKLQRADREAMIQVLTDKVETLQVILESCPAVSDIIQRIRSIFSDLAVGITHCTVHRSKGLEGDVIWILEPQLMPHPSAKQPWQKKQELNLKYVAITRAKRELHWVGA